MKRLTAFEGSAGDFEPVVATPRFRFAILQSGLPERFMMSR